MSGPLLSRYDHCSCGDCDGTGWLDVVEIVERDEGYGHISKFASKTSYPCLACNGRGHTQCFHKASP